MKLELHLDKSKIIPLHNGVKLLGFRMFYHYRLPRKNNIRSFEKKTQFLYNDTKRERESIDKLNKMLEGWFGYVMHGNTYKLRRKILKSIQQ